MYNNINLLDIFSASPVIEQEKIEKLHIESKQLYDKKHHKVKRKRHMKSVKNEDDIYSLRLHGV